MIEKTLLRKAREEKKMSQGALARAAGLARTTINRTEQGTRALTRDEAERIAAVLAHPTLRQAVCEDCPLHPTEDPLPDAVEG